MPNLAGDGAMLDFGGAFDFGSQIRVHRHGNLLTTFLRLRHAARLVIRGGTMQRGEPSLNALSGLGPGWKPVRWAMPTAQCRREKCRCYMNFLAPVSYRQYSASEPTKQATIFAAAAQKRCFAD